MPPRPLSAWLQRVRGDGDTKPGDGDTAASGRPSKRPGDDEGGSDEDEHKGSAPKRSRGPSAQLPDWLGDLMHKDAVDAFVAARDPGEAVCLCAWMHRGAHNAVAEDVAAGAQLLQSMADSLMNKCQLVIAGR